MGNEVGKIATILSTYQGSYHNPARDGDWVNIEVDHTHWVWRVDAMEIAEAVEDDWSE